MKRLVLLLLILCALPLFVSAAPKSYNDFVASLASPSTLDAQLPQGIRGILGTNRFLLIIGGAGTDYFTIDTQNGHVTATGRGRKLSPAPTVLIMTTRQTIDQILQAKEPGKATTQAIRDGRIRIQYIRSAGVRTRLALGAAQFGLLGSEPAVQGKNVGEVCSNGGECTTKNCVGVGQGPPWTYACSCDPFRYTTTGCKAEQPPVVLNDPGETCQHGGQCTTGNCVGVGQGPPWSYACSCDPFKYTTNC